MSAALPMAIAAEPKPLSEVFDKPPYRDVVCSPSCTVVYNAEGPDSSFYSGNHAERALAYARFANESAKAREARS